MRANVTARRAAGTPIGAVGAPAGSADGAAVVLDAERANLAALLAALGDGMLERLAGAVASARTVAVVGFRNGYPVALHLRTQLAQARPGVRLAPQPGQSLAEDLVGLGAGDLVVVCAFRRRPPGLRAALAAVVESGASLVVVGDPSARSILPPDAGDALVGFVPCPVAAPGAFDSYAAAMTFVALLASAVLGADLRAGRGRVSAIDRAYRALGETE
ncbi:MurR/RpiR family transcriptional regulator [Agromyces seonyuensis]|uniref:MurR/RpiR family transcriptional regulator n=1 Tax=Agromyces seonyuensis TaxID=2662446 RepID=A0A6I4P3V5_9MICO|nr:MurR/RpiR family transcriptional regulator [Agromyces seonyuensis]MWC00433.1 MurR/RpiR family transcriptional regulator [Agromyces seonyuensis]